MSQLMKVLCGIATFYVLPSFAVAGELNVGHMRTKSQQNTEVSMQFKEDYSAGIICNISSIFSLRMQILGEQHGTSLNMGTGRQSIIDIDELSLGCQDGGMEFAVGVIHPADYIHFETSAIGNPFVRQDQSDPFNAHKETRGTQGLYLRVYNDLCNIDIATTDGRVPTYADHKGSMWYRELPLGITYGDIKRGKQRYSLGSRMTCNSSDWTTQAWYVDGETRDIQGVSIIANKVSPYLLDARTIGVGMEWRGNVTVRFALERVHANEGYIDQGTLELGSFLPLTALEESGRLYAFIGVKGANVSHGHADFRREYAVESSMDCSVTGAMRYESYEGLVLTASHTGRCDSREGYYSSLNVSRYIGGGDTRWKMGVFFLGSDIQYYDIHKEGVFTSIEIPF